MKKLSLLALAVVATTAFAQDPYKDRWDGANTPSILDESFEYNFKKLPMSGDLSTKGLA